MSHPLTHTQLVQFSAPPQRRSPIDVLDRAERASLPWAAWTEESGLFFICLGSVIRAEHATLHDLRGTLSEWRLRLKAKADERALAQLPWIISNFTFAFNAPHCLLLPHDLPESTSGLDKLGRGADEGGVWSDWGRGGVSWVPALILCGEWMSPPKASESTRAPLVRWRESAGLLPSESTKLSDPSTQTLDSPLPLSRSATWTQLTSDLVALESHGLQDLAEVRSPKEGLLEGVSSEWTLDEPFESWRQRVEESIRACKEGHIEKIVMARRAHLTAPRGHRWSAAKTWEALHDHRKGVTPFALSPRGDAVFIGATPERLFTIHGQRLETHALAGTRLRGETPTERDRLREELTSDPKEGYEHELVSTDLIERLSDVLIDLTVQPRTIKTLHHLQHLETRISGQAPAELDLMLDLINLIDLLHPTPALGGRPRRTALPLLESLEPWERGCYGAPWMWSSLSDRARAYVGIRAALVRSTSATVFAGAGVVTESSAEAEWEETASKFLSASSALRSLPLSEVLQTSGDPLSLEQTGVPDPLREDRATHSLSVAIELMKTLRAEGVRGVVLSPGSRNTPLAMAAHLTLPVEVSVDERSAAFIALGWARALDAPIALCCTSGSAGAHYLPALIEAFYSAVPLIALTADRPPHLLGCGAPQTIDQRDLFGRHVKWARALELPQLFSWTLGALEGTRASMSEPRGPVHLNLPFEEPLWSLESEAYFSEELIQRPATRNPSLTPPLWRDHSALSSDRDAPLERPLALSPLEVSALSSHEGIIYCGPLSPQRAEELAEPLGHFARSIGWPVLTEAGSNLRGRSDLSGVEVRWSEAIGRRGALPESLTALVHIGGTPHARVIRGWMDALPQECVHFWIGERPEPSNPLALSGRWIFGQPAHALRLLQRGAQSLKERDDLSRRVHSDLHSLSEWLDLDTDHRPHPQSILWGGELGRRLSQLCQRAPEEGMVRPHLQVASSMSFRDLDLSLDTPHLTVWSSRGANGIDGTLSTALGLALALPPNAPLIVWLGDLALTHDLQGLMAFGQALTHHPRLSQRRAPVLILLSNNGGGGIFNHLPIAQSQVFTPYFFTPQSTHWAPLVHALDITHVGVHTLDDLSEALASFASPFGDRSTSGGIALIEVSIDPQIDANAHRSHWRGLARGART